MPLTAPEIETAFAQFGSTIAGQVKNALDTSTATPDADLNLNDWPDLIFVPDTGFKITVPPAVYWQLSAEENQSLPQADLRLAASNSTSTLTLGLPFFCSYFVVFDGDNNKLRMGEISVPAS